MQQQTDSVKADVQQRVGKESPFVSIFNIARVFTDTLPRYLVHIEDADY